LESSVLSEDGKCWLIRATDPFHDTQLRPSGYPDMNTSASVVQEINQSFTLATPSGLGGANWDAHIFNMPDFAYPSIALNMSAVGYNPNGCCVSGVTGTVPNAGVVIQSGPAGSNFMPWSVSPGTVQPIDTGVVASNLHPGAQLQGKCRLIGAAFEVINTTAELYNA
jgi:hypothetical protein